jgi:multiple sugar transport system permease protein/raffinose/stachyose/melibiose transport system permease protein
MSSHTRWTYRKRLCLILIYALVVITVLFFAFPFVWMISVAVKPPDELFTFPPRLVPNRPTLDNFQRAMSPEFLRYGLNSTIVAALTTVITLVVAIFSGYSFSRLRYPGRKVLLILILFTQLLPLAVLIVSMYRIMASLNMLDTYPALIIAYLTFTVPVGVWFLRGFFAAIPHELEEAAQIDGASRLQAFLFVALPVSLPGISATGAYVFFVTWQEFMFALAFTTSKAMRTLPVGILDFIGQYQTDWGTLMAASVLVFLPVFLLFFLMERQFIAGLTRGAIKG